MSRKLRIVYKIPQLSKETYQEVKITDVKMLGNIMQIEIEPVEPQQMDIQFVQIVPEIRPEPKHKVGDSIRELLILKVEWGERRKKWLYRCWDSKVDQLLWVFEE